jgi:hypothetical protein
VAVHLFQAGLVHVLMSVLGPVVVSVGVLVGHMVVLMRGVRMCVSLFAVLVFVRMRRVVGVLLGHGSHLLVRNMLSVC